MEKGLWQPGQTPAYHKPQSKYKHTRGFDQDGQVPYFDLLFLEGLQSAPGSRTAFSKASNTSSIVCPDRNSRRSWCLSVRHPFSCPASQNSVTLAGSRGLPL